MGYDNENFRIMPPQYRDVEKYLWLIIPAIAVLVLLSLSFYIVPTNSRGVVLRFGRFIRITDPGLHFKWPIIETALKPQVEHVFKEEFGLRTLRPGVRSAYGTSKLEESMMLCGDLSVAEVEWIVQYKISDAKAYLFNVREPEKLIRDVSESVMRAVVGDSSVDEVITSLREQINIDAEVRMQELLTYYGSGIKIEAVILQDVNPPEKVRPAFNDVNAAQQDKERLINQAVEEYNKVIPRAKGQALQVIQQAEAYAIDRTNSAEGDVSRFQQIWAEYELNKDVTRRRMYLESMGKILPRVERIYIIDENVKGLLPLLRLEEQK